MTYLVTYTETTDDGSTIRREHKVTVILPATMTAVRLAFWQTVHVYGEVVKVAIVGVQEIVEKPKNLPYPTIGYENTPLTSESTRE